MQTRYRIRRVTGDDPPQLAAWLTVPRAETIAWIIAPEAAALFRDVEDAQLAADRLRERMPTDQKGRRHVYTVEPARV